MGFRNRTFSVCLCNSIKIQHQDRLKFGQEITLLMTSLEKLEHLITHLKDLTKDLELIKEDLFKRETSVSPTKQEDNSLGDPSNIAETTLLEVTCQTPVSPLTSDEKEITDNISSLEEKTSKEEHFNLLNTLSLGDHFYFKQELCNGDLTAFNTLLKNLEHAPNLEKVKELLLACSPQITKESDVYQRFFSLVQNSKITGHHTPKA